MVISDDKILSHNVNILVFIRFYNIPNTNKQRNEFEIIFMFNGLNEAHFLPNQRLYKLMFKKFRILYLISILFNKILF